MTIARAFDAGGGPPAPRNDEPVSGRLAQAVELASIIVIGCCILLFGWAMLQNVARFVVPATLALLVLGALQGATIRRSFTDVRPGGRLRATRDLAFFAAIVFALAQVLHPQRWAIGACISVLEFGILLELLARFVPASVP